MIRKSFKTAFNISERCFCTATQATSFNSAILPNRQFVFESPRVTVPTFEISRRMGNLLAQSFYTMFYERNFSVESLVHGANKGMHSVAHFMADEKWDQMENLVVKETVDNMRVARPGISKRLEEALRFSSDDIIVSFVHSSIISGKDVLKLSKTRNIGIYFTVVSYIRLSDKVPENASITQLNGKFKNDVLVCNATFSRVLNPLGVWKITSVNFFI